MGKKLPERFLKADPDCPCDFCQKVKKTCRHCEMCYVHCGCLICENCDLPKPGAEPDLTGQYEGTCNCENCDNCYKRVDMDDMDDMEFIENDPRHTGGVQPLYCQTCAAKLTISEANSSAFRQHMIRVLTAKK